MLKSLLFSLTLMLCLVSGSSLTRAADETRLKDTAAESKSSTEELCKTLLKRLDTIESKLGTEVRQSHDSKETFWLFPFITAGLIGFAGTAGGFIIAQRFYQRRLIGFLEKQKEFVESSRRNSKTLHKIIAERSPSKKFTDSILDLAQKAAAQGIGIEVMWGKAILAQQEELWQDALIYWQAIIEQAPQDTTALFGASLAASQLSEKAEGKERQRLWQSTEKHFKAFPDEQLTAAVLSNWGKIYQNRGEAACDSRERELWYDKAAEKYAKATEYAPDDITSWCNWGVLCQSRGTAVQEKSKQELWYTEAEEKYSKALEINPQDSAVWYNMACLASLWQDISVCIDFLEQWRTYDPCASTDELDREKDFDKVRDTPEFQTLRSKLKTGQ